MAAGFKKPYRFNVSDTSGGLMIYVNEAIPSRRIPSSLPPDIQCIPIELNLRKQKWLVLSIYRHHSQTLQYFIDKISNQLDLFYKDYDNVILLGDFNDTVAGAEISSLIANQGLHSFISGPTCFKSSDGRCIDLILSNRKYSLQKSQSFETGLSDFHHLIYTMLKSTFTQLPPKKIEYRSMKGFSLEAFHDDLIRSVSCSVPGNFSSLYENIIQVVDKHAPLKTRVVRGNHKPHFDKRLRKALMKRSQLKNKANKTKDPDIYNLYKKQRNYIVNMNRKAKRSRFSATDVGSKPFWKLAKPFFSKSGCSTESKITLLENKLLVHDDTEIANLFNKYFVNITKGLQITPWCSQRFSAINTCPPKTVEQIVDKFYDHPSVVRIKAMVKSAKKFSFSHITPVETYKALTDLNSRKSTSGPIPSMILKKAAKVICSPLTDCFNSAILDGVFPSELKLARVIPVFKDGDEFDKTNYRPISILPSLSKVFERLLFDQISNFFKGILSDLLCGFRKNYSTQHALLNLLMHWQKSLDKAGIVGTVLMDLSKAFDSLPHDLLVAKLAAYGFQKDSLKLMLSYLSNRFQRTKIGSLFSEWLQLICGVPQGSILGPLLFNIFINDLLLIIQKTNICNFADDNTIYSCASSTEEVLCRLKYDLTNVLSWFSLNHLAANHAKFQMMFLGTTDENIKISVDNFILENKSSVKLLGVTLDKSLSLKEHIQNICSKASKGIRCLHRIRGYLDEKQALVLYNSYIQSNFNYCPLVWMFCSKTTYKMIESVQKRALRALYLDYDKSMEDFLMIDGIDTIHVINIRALLVEVYKTFHSLNPSFMRNIFVSKFVPYSLRNIELLELPESKTVRYGVNSLSFRSAILWNKLPASFKEAKSLPEIKGKLKSCSIFHCTCSMCKI